MLSKSTIYAAVLFFVLAFALYLGRIYESKHAAAGAGSALPTITAPVTATPAPVSTPGAPAAGAISLPVSGAAAAPATTAPAAVPTPATPAPDAAKKP